MYGLDKRRSMARSLLPSTTAKLARERLEHIHRAHRRSVRQVVRSVSDRSPDLETLDELDIPEYPQRLIRDVVLERRGADKVGSFNRWATAITSGLGVEDRLPHVRTIVPNNVIGWHALTHVESLEHYDPHFEINRWAYSCLPRARQDVITEEQLVLWLRALVENGGHKALNRELKVRGCVWPLGSAAIRVLRGFHDLESFASDVVASRPRGPRETKGTLYATAVGVFMKQRAFDRVFLIGPQCPSSPAT